MNAANKRSRLIQTQKKIEAGSPSLVRPNPQEHKTRNQIIEAMRTKGLLVPADLVGCLIPSSYIKRIQTIDRRVQQLGLPVATYIHAACVCARITTIPQVTFDFIAGVWVYEAIKNGEADRLLSLKAPSDEVFDDPILQQRQQMHERNKQQLQPVALDAQLSAVEDCIHHGSLLRAKQIRTLRTMQAMEKKQIISNILLSRPFSTNAVKALESPVPKTEATQNAVAYLMGNRTNAHPIVLFTCPTVVSGWKRQGVNFNGESYPQGLIRAQEAMAVLEAYPQHYPRMAERLAALRKAFSSTNTPDKG